MQLGQCLPEVQLIKRRLSVLFSVSQKTQSARTNPLSLCPCSPRTLCHVKSIRIIIIIIITAEELIESSHSAVGVSRNKLTKNREMRCF